MRRTNERAIFICILLLLIIFVATACKNDIRMDRIEKALVLIHWKQVGRAPANVDIEKEIDETIKDLESSIKK